MNEQYDQPGEGLALVNGRRVRLADATLALTDDGAVRGDGAFETVGVWHGRPFRLDDHLRRLNATLAALGLPAADADLLTVEVGTALRHWGSPAAAKDAALRIYVTAAGTRAVVVTEQPLRGVLNHLVPQPAPWIHPVGVNPLAGAKTMSYAPNMAATRRAREAGGDDALLLSLAGEVLEGPTFCVLWVRDGTVHTPAVDLGIIDSISRRRLLEVARNHGHEVIEGRWQLEDVRGAEEFMVCSSVRPLLSVRRVGDVTFSAETPVADALRAALDGERRAQGPAPVAEPADPNAVALERAALSAEMSAWLSTVATQVDSRLDRLHPAWRDAPQADAARACAFGLLLGHLARSYPHVRAELSRTAEAHPSLESLPTGRRLQVLEEVVGDQRRAAAWLGPLLEAEIEGRISLLFA